jgi:L-ascorbate metabolism protein UlaG (beta-lactamase superfamily)
MNEDTQYEGIMSSEGDICLYLGHASIFVRINGYKIIFDPVVISKPYGGSWTFFPPQFWSEEMFGVDAVVISHIHQDHYDTAFLKRLDSKVKIFIIEGRASFEESLKANGLISVIKLPPGDIHEIFPGVKFFGLLHEDNQVDASTLIYSENFSVYHGNDNYCSQELLDHFHSIVPVVSVACIPYAYIHGYPFLLDERLQSKEREFQTKQLIEKYFRFCISATETLQAKITIPFGANLVLNNGNAYSNMNMAVKTPLEFWSFAKENFPELALNIKALNSGDYIVSKNKELEVFQNTIETPEQYRLRMSDYLRAEGATKGTNSQAVRPVDVFLYELRKLIETKNLKLDFDIWVEMQLDTPLYVRVNFDKKIAESRQLLETVPPYYLFKLDEESSYAWLNGQSFEEIIGMRGFTLMRDPDEYRPDVLTLVNTVL